MRRKRRVEAAHDTKKLSTMKLAVGLAIGLPLAVLLVTSPVRQARAAFPGRNGKIAYDRQLGFGTTHIFATRVQGTHRRRLTHNRRSDFDPAFSANGNRIAFERFGDIAVMRADGSNPHRVTHSGFHDYLPAFAPDGRIVFTRTTQNAENILVMHTDGSHRHRLTHNCDCVSPAVSPNGRRIAFGRDKGIWVMHADGSHQRQVARLGGRPNYSPHGKRITFDRRFRGIWVMRADGSHTRRLTMHHGDSDPAFSPNGRRIAFYRGNPQQIWVMHTNGSHAHPVTHGRADSSEPDWGVRH